MPDSEENYRKQVYNSRMSIWICSYGGSGTNWLRRSVDMNMLRSNRIWVEKLCHYIRPIDNLPIKYAIYIYADPILAIVSQLKRGSSHGHILLQRNYTRMIPPENSNIPYSMKEHVKNMKQQMINWKNAKVNYPIILVKYEKLDKNLDLLFKTLEIRKTTRFNPRKTKESDIKNYYKKYNLNSCEKEIDDARKYYNSMPDFTIINP